MHQVRQDQVMKVKPPAQRPRETLAPAATNVDAASCRCAPVATGAQRRHRTYTFVSAVRDRDVHVRFLRGTVATFRTVGGSASRAHLLRLADRVLLLLEALLGFSSGLGCGPSRLGCSLARLRSLGLLACLVRLAFQLLSTLLHWMSHVGGKHQPDRHSK